MFDSEEQEPQSQKLYVFERKTVKPEDIKRLVAKGENAAVEFKRARGGVKAFADKEGYTACSLLMDDPYLASMRKARRCLAFLYGVGADAIEAATWYDALTAA